MPSERVQPNLLKKHVGHMLTCALRHSVLYEGETQRLRQELSDQRVCTDEKQNMLDRKNMESQTHCLTHTLGDQGVESWNRAKILRAKSAQVKVYEMGHKAPGLLLLSDQFQNGMELRWNMLFTDWPEKYFSDQSEARTANHSRTGPIRVKAQVNFYLC